VDREPAAWETNDAGPFLSVDEVVVYALGEDHFRLVAPDDEREVEGFEPALSAPCRQHPLRDTGRAMSENRDLVRSIVADWKRGDFGSVGWADAEIEFVIADGPEPVSLRGLRATLEYWREFLSSRTDYRLVGDGYRELNPERVLVLVHASGGRGKTSSVELGHHGGGGVLIFSVRADKVTRLVTYFNRERALADFGLEE